MGFLTEPTLVAGIGALAGVILAILVQREQDRLGRLTFKWGNLWSRRVMVTALWAFLATLPFAILVEAVGVMQGAQSGVAVSFADIAWSVRQVSPLLGVPLGLAWDVGTALSDPEAEAAPLSPRSSYRALLHYGSAQGLLAGIVFYVAVIMTQLLWILTAYDDGMSVRDVLPDSFLGDLLPLSILLTVVVTLVRSKALSVMLACLRLRATHGTPVMLLRFLDDAHTRGVLRTVGSVYQFRQGRLQDQLVGVPPSDKPR